MLWKSAERINSVSQDLIKDLIVQLGCLRLNLSFLRVPVHRSETNPHFAFENFAMAKTGYFCVLL